MDIVTDLFAQYSIEGLIIVVLMLAFGFKIVSELWEFFYEKLKKHFNYRNKKDLQHDELLNDLRHIKEKLEVLEGKTDELYKTSELTTARLQENSRSYIIDKHHYFCYQVKAIDDINLQSLERRYLYYKTAGGNSYIDGLMEEIRSLPRVNLQDPHIVNTILHKG